MTYEAFIQALGRLTRADVLSQRAFALCLEADTQADRTERLSILRMLATHDADAPDGPGLGLPMEQYTQALIAARAAYEADPEGYVEGGLSGGLWQSAAALTAQPLQPLQFVVEGLLPPGLTILASPPKYGKSWLMLDLCVQTALGGQLLGRRCTQSSCLYLALEDSPRRLQDRLSKMLMGRSCPKGFYYQTQADALGGGLEANLELFLSRHPDCRLVVIDTLQKVRPGADRAVSAYAADYRDASVLKALADRHQLCLVVVHHLRKMEDSADPFNRISGTNGLLGAADTSIVLTRANRDDPQTLLHLTGRDVEETCLALHFDKEAFVWRSDGPTQAEPDLHDANPIVRTIRRGLAEHGGSWSVRAGELYASCCDWFGSCPAASPRSLAVYLGQLAPQLYHRDGIHYATHGGGTSGRLHCFTRPDPTAGPANANDANDANNANPSL